MKNHHRSPQNQITKRPMHHRPSHMHHHHEHHHAHVHHREHEPKDNPVRGQKYNLTVLCELFVLGLLIAGLISVLITGAYQNYVTSRSFGWLIFLVFGLSLMFATAWQQRYQTRADSKRWQVLILAIPVILIMTPHQTVSTISFSTADQNAVQPGQDAYAQGQTENLQNQHGQPQDDLRRKTGETQMLTPKGVKILKPEEQRAAQDAETPAGYTPAPKTPSQQAQDGTENEAPADGIIKIADVNFYGWTAELLRNPDKYIGNTVTIKGFILTDYPDQTGNDFGLVRMCMACCAADMFPFGIIVEDNNNLARQQTFFANGAWAEITGTFGKTEKDGMNKVFISITDIKPAEKTQPEYVIPVY